MVIDSIAKLKHYLGDSSEEILVMKSNLASLYFYEGEYEKCKKTLNEAYNTMKTLNADHPLTLLMLKNLAYYYLDRKQFENAVDLFQELRDKVISKQGLKAQGVRTILLNHAISLYCNREYSKSLEVLNDAMKIAVSDVMSLLLNSTVEDGWSCKRLCVTSCFTCIENTFTCCIPCHFLTSNSSCNHVEVIVGCSLITTCSSYLCCCPLICLQTCFNQLK
jgi:ATP/maltotriose-dependent transcriptional regulator MalT